MTDRIAPEIPGHSRPVLTEAQRAAIRAVDAVRMELRRKKVEARARLRCELADLDAQIAALPSRESLAKEYGVSVPCIGMAARDWQYQHRNILDERAERRA